MLPGLIPGICGCLRNVDVLALRCGSPSVLQADSTGTERAVNQTAVAD